MIALKEMQSMSKIKLGLIIIALLLLAVLLAVSAFGTYTYLTASPQIAQAELSRAVSGRLVLPENAVCQGTVEKLDRLGFRASYSAYGGTYAPKQLLTSEKIGTDVDGAPCFFACRRQPYDRAAVEGACACGSYRLCRGGGSVLRHDDFLSERTVFPVYSCVLQ